MPASAMFPDARERAGMYESFYLRAVARDRAQSAWIRHTVHKRPGQRARGSVWCTVFDATRSGPFMHKLTSEQLTVPPAGWIAIGETGGDAERNDCGQGAYLTPQRAQGACGAARWSLELRTSEQELRHLPRRWLYRAPLPRTKLTSPVPDGRFNGRLELPGQPPIELRDWRGMVGHNWGSEHAERWIWLHGVDFAEAPEAWLDVALGRVKIGGRMTPWVANGALSLAGRRLRLGGLGARRPHVREDTAGCEVRLLGDRGIEISANVEVPSETAAGWRYADPNGSAHEVLNCSIASMALTLRQPGHPPRSLHSAHGAVYELGMREHDHGVPIAPFADG